MSAVANAVDSSVKLANDSREAVSRLVVSREERNARESGDPARSAPTRGGRGGSHRGGERSWRRRTLCNCPNVGRGKSARCVPPFESDRFGAGWRLDVRGRWGRFWETTHPGGSAG